MRSILCNIDPRVRPLVYCVQYRSWRKSPAYNLHCTQVFHARNGFKALGRQNHSAPRVINTDGHAAYPPAIAQLKMKERWTPAASTGRRRTSIMSWSRTTGPSSGGLTPARVSVFFGAAWRTLAGNEVIQMIRKGQACRSAGVRPVRGSVCSIALFVGMFAIEV